MVSNTVTLPHERKLRGKPLVLTWLGLWSVGAGLIYGLVRGAIWIAHVAEGLLK